MSEWSDAEQHAERAEHFYEAGEWDLALDELRQALAVNPYQSEWYFGLGLTLEALARHQEAAEAFEHVLSLRHEDPDALLHLGINRLDADEPRAAIEALEQLGRIEPDCEASYCHRILAYAQLGEHDNAELMFYLARQVAEECPACYDHLARSLSMRGELDRAIWCLHQTLRLDPHYPDAQANLAACHWALGRLEQARQDLLEQLRQQPGDLQSLMAMGYLLIELDRRSEAADRFRQALALDPTLAEAHCMLGELALTAGHLDAAQWSFDRAKELADDSPGAHLGLALLAQHRGNIPLAQRLAKKEIGRAGQRPSQILQLARLLIELDLMDDAAALLDEVLGGTRLPVLENDGDVAAALYLRGVAHLMAGRVHQGVADCRRSLRLGRNNTAAMYNLVVAHLQSRQFRRARAWLRRIDRLSDPASPVLRRLRYRLHFYRLLAYGHRWRRRLLRWLSRG